MRQFALNQQVPVALFGGRSRQTIEMVIGKACHRHFAVNTTLNRQWMDQADAAQFLWHTVCTNTVEEGLSIGATHIIFRKAG